MPDLDQQIAAIISGDGVSMIWIVAILLGLRHATDPDHLTAVSTLVLSDSPHRLRRANVLGLCWGLGHATTLLAFGLPVVLFRRYLPDWTIVAAEVAVGVLIVSLALRLLVRWRRGYFHGHPHLHGAIQHSHPHAHADKTVSPHPHAHQHAHADDLGRSPLGAFGIGLVHGIGGSAGAGILLVSAATDRFHAALALVLFAIATAVSMGFVSWGLGYTLAREPIARRLAPTVPLLGVASLLFGLWYAVSAFGGPLVE